MNLKNALVKLGRQLEDGSRNFLILILRSYQLFISPWFLPSCRFYPSCSQYAVEAYKKKKVTEASLLVIKRVSKCHPFGGHGYDPVPFGEPRDRHQSTVNLAEAK